MPANPYNGFTEYGIGIGLRVPHYQHILAKKPVVEWLGHPRRFMVSDLLRHFQPAAVLWIRGDTGRAEGMIANP